MQRVVSRVWVLFGWMLVVVLAACGTSAGGPDESIGKTQSALTQSLTLAVKTPVGIDIQNVAAAAGQTLKIDDRARLLTLSGGYALSTNAGTTLTDFGTDTQVGSIVSRASTTLHDRARVTGFVTSGGNVILGNSVVVTGRVLQNQVLTPLADHSWTVQFPVSTQAVTVPNDQTSSLAPGAYGAVTVYSRATLRLQSGIYYLDQLDLEPQATIVLQSAPIVLYLRTNLIFRGQVTGAAPQDFFVGLFGTNPVAIESSFNGTLVSNGPVRMATGSTTHSGQVIAPSVEIDPGVTFTLKPFSHWDARVSIFEPAEGAFVGRDITVRGSVTGDPSATVRVNGVLAAFNGLEFNAPVSFAADGPATITVTATTVLGTTTTVTRHVMVDATPLHLVDAALPVPKRRIVSPPGQSGGLTAFRFDLSEAIDPASFSLAQNVTVDSRALIQPSPATPTVSTFFSSFSIGNGGRQILLNVNAGTVVPGVTYGVTLHTSGLRLSASGRVVGVDERPESAVARVTVLNPGQAAPRVQIAKPTGSLVAPHERVSVVFSEQMDRVSYSVTAKVSTSIFTTRLGLDQRLVPGPGGAHRTALVGSSRVGLLLDADYVVRINAAGTIDTSGTPLASDYLLQFHTAPVRIDAPRPGQSIGSTVQIAGSVAASVAGSIQVELVDKSGTVVVGPVAALRAPALLDEFGTAIQTWGVQISGIPGTVRGIRVVAGGGAEHIGVIQQAGIVELGITSLAIEPSEIQSGSGTETDPYVVLRDNLKFSGKIGFADNSTARPGKALVAESGSGCGTVAPKWVSESEAWARRIAAGDDAGQLLCIHYVSSEWGWNNVRPEILISEVGSDRPAQSVIPIADNDADGTSSVSWHRRGGLFWHGPVFRVIPRARYYVSNTDANPTTESTKLDTTVDGEAPIYVKLSDTVKIAPMFYLSWSLAWQGLESGAAPLWRATDLDNLLDARNGETQAPTLTTRGVEQLSVGGTRHEAIPDDMGRRCFTDYGLCSAQFQWVGGALPEARRYVNTTEGQFPPGGPNCDRSNQHPEWGFRFPETDGTYYHVDPLYTDGQGHPLPKAASTEEIRTGMLTLLPPDQAAAISELRPPVLSEGWMNCGGQFGYNGQYTNDWTFTVNGTGDDGPEVTHEFGHYQGLFGKQHCGDPTWSDPDTDAFDGGQCHDADILMSQNPDSTDTKLSGSMCQTLCSALDIVSPKLDGYREAEKSFNFDLTCCVASDGSKSIQSLNACEQAGGRPSDAPFAGAVGVGGGTCSADQAQGPSDAQGVITDPTATTECCEQNGAFVSVPIGDCGGTPVDAQQCTPIIH